MNEPCQIILDERYQVLPSMPPEQFAALKSDIAERGVLVPIDITEDGYILDGHHRYRACVELGITDFPTIVRLDLDETQRRTFARQNNVLRRHLTRAQIRELMIQQIKETPEWANNRIAQSLGVDKKTVQTQRKRLESTGEIPKLTQLVGLDGKKRKVKRPAAIMSPNADALLEIMQKLRQGVSSDELTGFLSATDMPKMYAPDPNYTKAEAREWRIAFATGWIDPERSGWFERQEFRTPSEYFGPEGQRYMARFGMGSPNPEKMDRTWQATLERYREISDAELDTMERAAAEKHNQPRKPTPKTKHPDDGQEAEL